MTQQFEVIGDGWDDDNVHGVDLSDVEGADVLGADVLGYSGPMGYDDISGHGGHHHRGGRQMVVRGSDGGAYLVVGAGPAKQAIPIKRPPWRGTQLAPGVIAPDQGLLPLPLSGQGGTNTFTSAINQITFEGQIQKPFRGERLLVSTIRTGVSAVGRLLGQLFVGTDLQQLDVPGFDIEQVGAVTGFGVRLTMKPAQPGVFIRVVTTLNVALAPGDTINATVTILGRNVH